MQHPQYLFVQIFRAGLAIGITLGALVGLATAGPGSRAAAQGGATGAAAGTTGGAGRAVITVTSLADSGTGTLRAAMAAGGGDVRFASTLSGSLTLSSPVRVPSNTTLDGNGAKVVVRNRGLLVEGVNNVIIRNIRMQGITGDAIAVQGGARKVWIDHVDLSGLGASSPDGLVDVTLGATAVTISWSRFTDHDKVMLLGAGAPEGLPALVDITVHHNLFLTDIQRQPMMRHGRFHVYNNVLKSWGYDEPVNDAYGMRAACGTLARVEANIFRPRVNIRGTYMGYEQPACEATRAPALDLVANDAGGATLVEEAPERVPPMPDTAEAADSVLQAKVESSAGVTTPTSSTSTSAPSSTTTIRPTTTTAGPVTTTTAPATTTTLPETPTTLPATTTTLPPDTDPPLPHLPLVPEVTLQQASRSRLSLSWTTVLGASRYYWEIRTCDDRVVANGTTDRTSVSKSSVRRGCYRAAVRSDDPLGLWGYSEPVQVR